MNKICHAECFGRLSINSVPVILSGARSVAKGVDEGSSTETKHVARSALFLKSSLRASSSLAIARSAQHDTLSAAILLS